MEEKALQIFNNPAFGSVRVVEIEDQPWFVGKDVAEALGYSNTGKAIITHVDEEDKQILNSHFGNLENTPNRGMYFINESGLYNHDEWYSIWRVARINRIPRKKIAWRRLKQASEETGCNIKKIFDPNGREINLYHVKAWELAYPNLEL